MKEEIKSLFAEFQEDWKKKSAAIMKKHAKSFLMENEDGKTIDPGAKYIQPEFSDFLEWINGKEGEK